MSYTQERIGQPVTFVDEVSKPHDALVTADWTLEGADKPGSLNLVFVSDDESQGDPYGRQIIRKTSVPHQNDQSAHGNYWK